MMMKGLGECDGSGGGGGGGGGRRERCGKVRWERIEKDFVESVGEGKRLLLV